MCKCSLWPQETNPKRFFTAPVKSIKPWVKVGISPRGIWQPGYPTGINGFNAYKGIYADSRLWLSEGWMDYFSPQLYWSIGQTKHSFSALLQWWAEQNGMSRHLWPGLATYKLNDVWSPTEIINQIRITRERTASPGHLHFRATHVLDEKRKFNFSRIRSAVYREQALIPPSPWMRPTPSEPMETRLIKSEIKGKTLELSWNTQSGALPRWWLYQAHFGQVWQSRVIPGRQNEAQLDLGNPNKLPKYISWRPIDAYGETGKALVLRLINPKTGEE